MYKKIRTNLKIIKIIKKKRKLTLGRRRSSRRRRTTSIYQRWWFVGPEKFARWQIWAPTLRRRPPASRPWWRPPLQPPASRRGLGELVAFLDLLCDAVVHGGRQQLSRRWVAGVCELRPPWVAHVRRKGILYIFWAYRSPMGDCPSASPSRAHRSRWLRAGQHRPLARSDPLHVNQSHHRETHRLASSLRRTRPNLPISLFLCFLFFFFFFFFSCIGFIILCGRIYFT